MRMPEVRMREKNRKRLSMARPSIIWTDEMLDCLTREYPITFNGVLARRLGVSISSIRRKASELELVKAGSGRMNYKTWETVERLSLLTVTDRLPVLQGFPNGQSGVYAGL